jgi:hypothetical protein
MEKVFLKEFIDLSVIALADLSQLKVLHPVAARVLKVWRKTLRYPTAANLTYGGT